LPCYFPYSCSYLPQSIFFSFCVDDCSSSGKNITVPLATFASEVYLGGTTTCQLWVVEREYLSNGAAIQGSQIIIGNLFHQTFAAQYNTLTGQYYLQTSSAVSGTEFGGYFGQLFQAAQNNNNSPFAVQQSLHWYQDYF